MLACLSERRETPRNAWYLPTLAAQGHLFQSQRERAVNAAREALDLMPASRDAFAHNTRYRTLAERLEAQIRATEL